MLKKILINIILNGAALYGVTLIIPEEIVYTGGIKFFVFGAIAMGVLNSIVKPLLKLVTFPLHILTLGLSLVILNGIIFWLFEKTIDSMLIEGISLEVKDFISYLLAGFLFGIINWVEHLLIRTK